MPQKPEIFTTLILEDLNGVKYSLSELDKEFAEAVKSFKKEEAISFTAFLNMICQTQNLTDLIDMSWVELKRSQLTKYKLPKKVPFVRDNLLLFIKDLLLSETNGTEKITGSLAPTSTAQNYYKSLLLINSKANSKIPTLNPRKSFIKETFIKDFPSSHFPRTILHIYFNRIVRYCFTFNEILPTIDPKKTIKLNNAISQLESLYKVSLNDIYYTLSRLAVWFLGPVISAASDHKKIGFDYNNPDSFYINKNNFAGDTRFLNVIDHLSVSLDALKDLFIKKTKPYSSTSKYGEIPYFFEAPIFKIDENQYCLLDLKFTLEKSSNGTLWNIIDTLGIKPSNIKDDYGQLLEAYFLLLVKKIFPSINTEFASQNGQPDAILEFRDHILIFEFTTEFHRMGDLYSDDDSNFESKLHEILFNKGPSSSNPKKSKGKMFNLNGYVEVHKKNKKKVIPILVCENGLGDYTALDEFDNMLTKGINDDRLENLKEFKPLIINLDDLETFWAHVKTPSSCYEFIKSIQKWEKTNKWLYFGSFTYFLSNYYGGLVKNSEYKSFFNLFRTIEKT